MNVVVGLWVIRLVVLNYRRREDVVFAMRGAVEALGLLKEGEYLRGRPIHAFRFDTSWKRWYIWLVVFFCLVQLLPLFMFPRG